MIDDALGHTFVPVESPPLVWNQGSRFPSFSFVSSQFAFINPLVQVNYRLIATESESFVLFYPKIRTCFSLSSIWISFSRLLCGFDFIDCSAFLQWQDMLEKVSVDLLCLS